MFRKFFKHPLRQYFREKMLYAATFFETSPPKIKTVPPNNNKQTLNTSNDHELPGTTTNNH